MLRAFLKFWIDRDEPGEKQQKFGGTDNDNIPVSVTSKPAPDTRNCRPTKNRYNLGPSVLTINHLQLS